MISRNAPITLACLTCATAAIAEVPTYRVEVIAPITNTTQLTGASDAGHLVGWMIINGQSQAFIATLENGVTMLPLPDGYTSASAMDANNAGVVVGAVAGSSSPSDGGAPAIWMPDGMSGYSVHVPQQFTSHPSPLGDLQINGGMAVAVNDHGTVVGWSRYFGFQGGPTTMFSIDQPPVSLSELGFAATVTDINNNGIAVGGTLLFDTNSNTVTDLGTPGPFPTTNITFGLGYAINDHNEVVAAAARATSGNDVWITALHDGDSTWSQLNPSQIGTRFVGFYDNNNLGDVSASGGVLFANEDTLVQGYTSLLEPEFAGWIPAIGYINSDRSVYTTAQHPDSTNHSIVALIPTNQPCDADLNGDLELDFFDISAFLTAFRSGDPSADFTNDSVLDFFDISAFLSIFSAGCP